MTSDRREAVVRRLLAEARLSGTYSETLLRSGANNRVSRLDGVGWQVILKEYFRHELDPRDRFATEYRFLTYADTRCRSVVPRPLGGDAESGLALYEFIDGQRDIGRPIVRGDVDQALSFFRALNVSRHDAEAAGLPPASEACFSLCDHAALVSRRVEMLRQASTEVARFANRTLEPIARRLMAEITARPDATRPLSVDERCISPSDFGFHNALMCVDGRWKFIDFEYGGWDDPAKTTCDFFCQPQFPVPIEFFEYFARGIGETLTVKNDLLNRSQALLPLYRLKWACIMLNAALRAGSARRRFAGHDGPGESDSPAAIERVEVWLKQNGFNL